ncbi:MAG: XisH family protein, partial [Saprospiraceae bacterium]
MAKHDLYHDLVKRALVNEGWIITHDPYLIKVEDVRYEIDLGAEILLAAEREGRKIAVEVKSFIEQSTVHAFHLAIGQYIDYLVAMEETEPERELYLAVPETVYDWFFTKAIIQKTLRRINVQIIIYSIENENIAKWVK